jgi:hypothetical protein
MYSDNLIINFFYLYKKQKIDHLPFLKIFIIFFTLLVASCSSISIDQSSKVTFIEADAVRNETIPICSKNHGCQDINIPVKYKSKEISVAYSKNKEICYLLFTGIIDKELRENFDKAHNKILTFDCQKKSSRIKFSRRISSGSNEDWI